MLKMLIEDAMVVVTNYSKGLHVPEHELRAALPTVLLYANMMVEVERKEDE